MYYYINHELQTLFAAYNKENESVKNWEICLRFIKEKECIIEGLPLFTRNNGERIFSCIDFKKEEEKAGLLCKKIKKVKKAFFSL